MPVESAEWSSARALCIELDTGKKWQKWQQQMERPEKEVIWVQLNIWIGATEDWGATGDLGATEQLCATEK